MGQAAEFNFYDIVPLAANLAAGDLILTPNHRLARCIRQAWGQHLAGSGKQCWVTPAVMSLEHWLLDCHERRQLAGELLAPIASARQQLTLWTDCVREHPQSRLLLRPRASAQLAMEAWQNLLLWRLDWNSEPLNSYFRYDLDASLFLDWADEFERRLAAAGLCHLLRQGQQLAAVQAGPRIVLAEFNEISPWHRQLLQNQAGELVDHHNCQPPGESRLLRAETRDHEYRLAADRARQVLEQGGGRRLGILVPALHRERASVERILRRQLACEGELPVNISAGVPLAHCPPVRTAIQLLRMHSADPLLPELVELLHSRYRYQAQRESETRLLQRLYQRGRRTVPRSLLRSECARIKTGEQAGDPGLALGEQLRVLLQRRELAASHRPSAWAGIFLECLESFGWPGPGPFNSVEFQQLDHMEQALQGLAELDPVCGSLNWAAALQHLTLACEEIVFQPQSAASPVQVLGLLEAAGLCFDEIWICGMSDSDWPTPARPNPFIPVSIQLDRELPHAGARRELEYAKQLLCQLRDSGADFTASFAPGDSDMPSGPSPLLSELTRAAVTTAEALPAHDWQDVFIHSSRERIIDDRAPQPGPEELANQRGGSALLADQSQCPFRAFARHRLRVRTLPVLEDVITAGERGNLLHDALYLLWGELEDSEALRATTGTARSGLIAQCVQQATGKLRGKYPDQQTQAILDIEVGRLQALLEAWLNIESEREAFSVMAREEPLSAQIGGLTLNLCIDRIDRTAAGDTLLIDYKSGSCEVRYWMGERPRDPQLPLYATALQGAVSALAFARIRGNEQGFKGLGQDQYAAGISTTLSGAAKAWARDELDWCELNRLWQQSLEKLAQDYLDGCAAVDPAEDSSCKWCGLEALCRI